MSQFLPRIRNSLRCITHKHVNVHKFRQISYLSQSILSHSCVSVNRNRNLNVNVNVNVKVNVNSKQVNNNNRYRGFSTESASQVEDDDDDDDDDEEAHRVHKDEIQQVIKEGEMKNIRNFSIIAHIDHGKSTLADRLLSLCGNISLVDRSSGESQNQVLDSLQVERERGITVKAQTASMFWRGRRRQQEDDGEEAGKGKEKGKRKGEKQIYHLNLIDTPGHVDFSYEVSRSLAACTGALLVVDASQGIQAQTLANYEKAKDAKLDIIPILNKIDLPHADIEGCKDQLLSAFNIPPSSVLCVSSKTGFGIPAVLRAIVDRIRAPSLSVLNELNGDGDGASVGQNVDKPLRALLFDSWFDVHRGVVCLINVVDGYIAKGDKICAYHGGGIYEVQELGILMPAATPVELLRAGQVGYVIAGIKSSREVRLGETFLKLGSKHRSRPTSFSPMVNPAISENLFSPQALGIAQRGTTLPLPGFKPAKSMVFAGLFPIDSGALPALSLAIDKLCLNDASVSVERESSVALGTGFRCGFLGVLHLDVFKERLEQEFGQQVIVTAPTVPYVAQMKDGSEIRIDSPTKFPESDFNVESFNEPMILATIICPSSCLGPMTELWTKHRGTLIEMSNIGSSSSSSPSSSSSSSPASLSSPASSSRLLLRLSLPLAEIVLDFCDHVKSLSSGYASFDYEESGTQIADLVRVSILVNGEVVDALSSVCARASAVDTGRRVAAKLKELVDRQSFEIIVQAAVNGKIVARERIQPYRKDVLVKGGKTVGGGDVTRKRKLLDKQKEGKKRMKMVGNVEMGHHVFTEVMRIR